MGISGLFNLIKNDHVFDMVDLVNESKRLGGIEILVDFSAIMRFIKKTVTKKIAQDFDNEYLYFPIGVYDIFADAMYDLQKGFDNVGIRLVWIVRGVQGLDEQNKATWIQREQRDSQKMSEVLEASNAMVPLHDPNYVTATLYFETALSALKKAGAEVINLLQRECDDFITYEFHRRKSYAIFTNDTDFVIFKDCVILFEQLLNTGYEMDKLKLPFIDNDNPGKIFRQPESLLVPLVKQSHILERFKFSDSGQMIALSILRGNDNSSAWASELQLHLRITDRPDRHPHVTRVAQFINKLSITADNIDQKPDIKKFLERYPQFQEAINFTRDMYSLRRIEENLKKGIVIHNSSIKDNSLVGFLAEKLAHGETSKDVYSFHFGIYRDWVCLERPTEHCPPIQTLLFEIRTRIYPYILDEKLTKVVEWRAHMADIEVDVPVIHASFKTHMIKALPEDDDQYTLDKYGIDLFEDVMSHQETNGSLNYVKKYGVEVAFVCYLLRYFYRLTDDKNLRVTEKEFRALFVTVFYQYSRCKQVTFTTQLNNDIFFGMKICPSERCLIIITWFMNIYFTAKYLCGGVFNLTEEFLSISNMFSGPLFYAFYENLMCDDNGRTSHLEDSLVECVGLLEEDVMSKYGGEYATVTEHSD